jgi:hypothetical protein
MGVRAEFECGATIWCGFFGKDDDGNHDECVETIEVEVDEYDWENARVDGDGRWVYVNTRCPHCRIHHDDEVWAFAVEEARP